MEHTASEVLWRVLINAYRQLGFDQVGDEVFTSLVAVRIVEPTSKLDTVRVLGELGPASPACEHPVQLPAPLRAAGLPRPGRDGVLGARECCRSCGAGDV